MNCGVVEAQEGGGHEAVFLDLSSVGGLEEVVERDGGITRVV